MTPTSCGSSACSDLTRAARSSLYFDGSDVGLTTDGEDVDTIEQAGGKLLLSTTGGASLRGGLLSADEDVLEFTAMYRPARTR